MRRFATTDLHGCLHTFRRLVEEELQDDLFSRVAEETQTPLLPMTPMERLESDYHSLRFTAGGHPMKHLRESMGHVWRADELIKGKDGQWLSIAGLVICRQRPGTAKRLFVYAS